MLVHLVATLALVVIACVLLWAVFHHLGRAMPRALLPIVAGSVAIGYGIYTEYSWGWRTEDALPDSFVVLKRVEERSALAPWTWLVKPVVRLSAIDLSAVRRHPAHPDLRLLEVFLLERFYPARHVAQLVDCAGARRADIVADEGLDADGLPTKPLWRVAGPDDALISKACTG